MRGIAAALLVAALVGGGEWAARLPERHDDRYQLVRDPADATFTRALVVLHGSGEGPAWTERTLGFDGIADDLDARIVYPLGIGSNVGWNAVTCCGEAVTRDVDDVRYLRLLSDRLRQQGARQVFVVGTSNGGMMAYRLACEEPAAVDGLVVFSGAISVDQCDGAFRALHVHGTADDVIQVEGGWNPVMRVRFRPLSDVQRVAHNARARVRLVPGMGHEWPHDARQITVRQVRAWG